MQELNPPFVIKPYKVNDDFDVKVVRDDVLKGGTKQRALIPLLRERPETEFVVIAANDGLAQVALSHAAAQVGKKATIFVAHRKKPSKATLKAESLGGKIMAVKPGYLTVRTKRAKDYVAARNKKKPGSTCLFPLGVDDPAYEKHLRTAIRSSLPKGFKSPRRIWITVGSGVLMRNLGKVWPKAQLLGLQVGKEVDIKKVLGDKRSEKAKLHVEDRFKFEQSTKKLPPYPSMANYDGKIWDWVERFGQEGDLVWNVGTDE